MKRTRLVWQMGIRPLMEAPNEKHACPTDSEDYLQRTSTRSWPARSGHFLSRTVCTTVWSTPQCEISSMAQSLKAQLCSNVPQRESLWNSHYESCRNQLGWIQFIGRTDDASDGMLRWSKSNHTKRLKTKEMCWTARNCRAKNKGLKPCATCSNARWTLATDAHLERSKLKCPSNAAERDKTFQ